MAYIFIPLVISLLVIFASAKSFLPTFQLATTKDKSYSKPYTFWNPFKRVEKTKPGPVVIDRYTILNIFKDWIYSFKVASKLAVNIVKSVPLLLVNFGIDTLPIYLIKLK